MYIYTSTYKHEERQRKDTEHKGTPLLVSPRVRRVAGCRKHAEHEKTLMMVSPCVRHASLGEEKMLSKEHQRWCLLVQHTVLEFYNGRYVPLRDIFYIRMITISGTRACDPPFSHFYSVCLFVHSLDCSA